MGTGRALIELLDMGIPGGRAKAALVRSKGDAMSAAERVYAGEFDHIPSDDEGNDELPAQSSTSNSTSGLLEKRLQTVVVDSDDDADMGNDYDMHSAEEDALDDTRPLFSDPYAGIFFSKDRSEKVIEPIEETRQTTVRWPEKPGSRTMKHDTVDMLGRSEWMSGCPEGNEQSFLFQLYSMLEDSFGCPEKCGHTFRRKAQDFFVLFPDFASYTTFLSRTIRADCPRCKLTVCRACGERVSNKHPALNHHMKLQTPESQIVDNNRSCEFPELLHCPPLQGVILGVGLHMIEKAFARSSQPASRPITVTPPAKRRRTGGVAGIFEDELVTSLLKNTSGVSALTPKHELSEVVLSDGEEEDYEDDYDDIPGFASASGLSKASKGIGYGGQVKEDRAGETAAANAQKIADQHTAKMLSQIRVYLPSIYRSGGAQSSDHLVHPTALAHLRRRSGFVNDLLRNDSLLDMSDRSDLYRALFDWLEIISSHESLASMLAMPQMRPASIKPDPDVTGQQIVVYEGASSPRELLESCVIQAQAALKGLEATSHDDDTDTTSEEYLRMSIADQAKMQETSTRPKTDKENLRLLQFCKRIIESARSIDRSLIETKGQAFVDRMQAGLPRLPGASDGSVAVGAGQSHADVVKIYEGWVTNVRFQYCDMTYLTTPESTSNVAVADEIAFSHAYSARLASISDTSAPKRSLAIAKELAILTRNLPVSWNSSIFLRVDESRVDCIKAMIIGPEGTPYENGCFIFDIFLPLEYNQIPPEVKSMTTNGGKYRYNPNLYADGKVCLSLLGTWSGPGWVSGRSTLLQVLISIQSLILCEEPYLNEPGWASGAGTAASKAYSANCRRMTLLDAMGNNLRSPPKPFEDEIRTHFRLKAVSIREQIKKWKQLDDNIATRGESFGSSAPSLLGKKMGSSSETSFDKAAAIFTKLLDDIERPEGANLNFTDTQDETSIPQAAPASSLKKLASAIKKSAPKKGK